MKSGPISAHLHLVTCQSTFVTIYQPEILIGYQNVSEKCIALISNYSYPAGGLFGSNTFSQPATSSTSTGFGFGPSSGTSTSLFGNTGTGTTTSLFSNQNNAFGSTKPTTFGSKGLCRHSLNNILLNLP